MADLMINPEIFSIYPTERRNWSKGGDMRHPEIGWNRREKTAGREWEAMGFYSQTQKSPSELNQRGFFYIFT
jgi:hypothetical protein